LMSDVNCVSSLRWCCDADDAAGDESDCNTISCVRDRRCLVLLQQLDDPTCGVVRGRSLTCVWLADWSVNVPSGLIWCVFNLLRTWCCSSGVNASEIFIGRLDGGMFSYKQSWWRYCGIRNIYKCQYILSTHIISYHIISYPIISYHIISHLVIGHIHISSSDISEGVQIRRRRNLHFIHNIYI
jgi:hypothetical protein